MMKAAVAILLFSAQLFAQPRVYVDVPLDSLKWSPKAAMISWLLNKELNSPEKTVLCYIKQGFWWKYRDSIEYRFSIDSIKGRGDKRQALFGIAWKTRDSTKWYWYTQLRREPPAGVTYDSVLYDSIFVGPTGDSTTKITRWLTYMPKLFDKTLNTWYFPADTTGPPIDQMFVFGEDSTHVNHMIIRLDKILGDPTRNFGWDQRAVLKISYMEVATDSLWRWIDQQP